MIVAFVVATVVGFSGMVLASQRAVGSATELAAGTQIPPIVVGMTLLSVGTDLPEIAYSVIGSLTDHGDAVVGDSVGSAATQMTLVLGLLPLVAGPMVVPRRGVAGIGLATLVSMAVLVAMLADGEIGRLDGVVLVSMWIGGSWVLYRRSLVDHQLTITEPTRRRGALLAETLGALAVVGGTAALALWGLVGVADTFDAPELLVSFFVASLGTSLPELVFDLTALRKGAVALAIGDVLGSSFIDASLSIGLGPIVAPIEVSRDLAVEVTVVAAVAVAAVTLVLSRLDRHDWRSGVILLGIYAGFFVALLR